MNGGQLDQTLLPCSQGFSVFVDRTGRCDGVFGGHEFRYVGMLEPVAVGFDDGGEEHFGSLQKGRRQECASCACEPRLAVGQWAQPHLPQKEGSVARGAVTVRAWPACRNFMPKISRVTVS